MRRSLGWRLATIFLFALAGAPLAVADDPGAAAPAPSASAPPASADQPAASAPVPAQVPTGTFGPQDLGTEASQPAFTEAPVLTPEEAERQRPLRERVQQRWDAVIAGDFAKAYEYESPEYRKEHTLKEYVSQFGGMVEWHMASVKEVRYDGDNEAEVVLSLGISFSPTGGDDPVRTTAELEERWAKIEGKWWRSDLPHPLGSDDSPEPSQQE